MYIYTIRRTPNHHGLRVKANPAEKNDGENEMTEAK